MRNFMILFALTVAFLSAATTPGTSAKMSPPSCGNNCPWVR